MTDILHRRLAVSPNSAESAVGDETVILHLVNGTYYGLDAVGTRIWALLKQGCSGTQICATLAAEYETDLATVEQDTREFLASLEAQDILIAA